MKFPMAKMFRCFEVSGSEADPLSKGWVSGTHSTWDGRKVVRPKVPPRLPAL
jgi:hypothetical protein